MRIRNREAGSNSNAFACPEHFPDTADPGYYQESKAMDPINNLSTPSQRKKVMESFNLDQSLKGKNSDATELDRQARFVSGKISIEDMVKEILEEAYLAIESSLGEGSQLTHQEREQERRRKEVEQANANRSLSGWNPDAEDLARDDRLIRGEITTTEAIQEIKDSIILTRVKALLVKK